MTLTHGDDYPIHQTPEPIAFSGTDRNFYDRYFFNGYAPDGSGFFAAAFGVYPHLDVVDAHFSFIRGGTQHCLHASRRLGMERMDLSCGPISIHVEEPLKRLRVRIEETDGIAGEFTFGARAFPIAEPRFIHRIGPRAFMDYTRMTQNGRYEGWISCDSERHEIAQGTLGTRDRSWGVRPVGARDAQPMPGHELPQFFWQWTPINLANGSLFFHLNADAQGEAWNTRAAFVPDGGAESDIAEGHGTITTRTEEGSRWPAGAVLDLDVPGAPAQVSLEAMQRFQMKGLGYTHPVWGHGIWHGSDRHEREDFDLAQLDPLQPDNRHVQILCKVDGDAQGQKSDGWGVFEQLAIGPYAPLGFTGI